MNFMSITEAAKEKGCTRAAVWGAIQREALDGQKIGNAWAIKKNKKYSEWMPNPKVQQAGKARWKDHAASA